MLSISNADNLGNLRIYDSKHAAIHDMLLSWILCWVVKGYAAFTYATEKKLNILCMSVHTQLVQYFLKAT